MQQGTGANGGVTYNIIQNLHLDPKATAGHLAKKTLPAIHEVHKQLEGHFQAQTQRKAHPTEQHDGQGPRWSTGGRSELTHTGLLPYNRMKGCLPAGRYDASGRTPNQRRQP